MSNMSYCRFENTSRDMEDCLRAIIDGQTEDLNEYEARSLLRMMRQCEEILRWKDDVESQYPQYMRKVTP